MNFKKLSLLLGIVILFASFVSAQDLKYIGAAKCKMCHNKEEKGGQYAKWAAGPHAKAMASLKAADAKNPKCLKCHSTAAAANPDMIATITVEEGVSCESCHGPGSAYKIAAIMKDKTKAKANGLIIPDEKLCRKCHNKESPNYKEFNFAEYSKKIAHKDPSK